VKRYLVLIVFASVVFNWSGCTSTRSKVAKNRDAQDQKEPWRYDLPVADKALVRPVFPQVKRSQLKNGLQILVVEDHRLPIAQVSLVLKAGSAKDPHNFAGLTHLSAQMLKEGTISKSSLELAEEFANLGTEVSVSVGKDATQIAAEVLSNKVDETFALLASMAKNPRLSGEDFARVKLQHQSLIASQQANPSYVAQTSFLMAAYGEKHPYAHPSAGTLKTVNKIKLKDIKKAVHDNFGANVSALVAVGDVTLMQMEKLAKQYLGSWHKVSGVAEQVSDPQQAKQMQTRLVARPDSPQTYLLVGQVAASRKDKNLASIEVFQNIIAGLPTSRLGANLREAKGWTYGVGTQMSPLLGKGPLMITTSVQTPYGADALSEIFNEFDKLKKEPVSDEELTTAKNGLLHSFSSRYSTVSQVASSLTDQFIYGLPEHSDEVLYDQIAQVSKADIMVAANRLLKKDQTVAVAVGDLESLQMPIATMDMGKVLIEKDSAQTAP
jgi:zinc protease